MVAPKPGTKADPNIRLPKQTAHSLEKYDKNTRKTVRICDLPLYFVEGRVFSFQNNPKDLDPSCNPKDLDPSCKTNLDLWDCVGRVKLVLEQNFIGCCCNIVVLRPR